MKLMTLSGRVVTGQGQGALFTQIGWAREQFLAKLGVDPFPGTLNLLLERPEHLVTWTELKATPGNLIISPDSRWCNARGYPVRVKGWLPAAIIFPEVPDYPETQIEVIAALALREKFSLRDGDLLSLTINQPLTVDAVIFDVDGTLVDSLEAYQRVAEVVVAPYGVQVMRDAIRTALNTNQMFWDIVLPSDQPNRVEVIQQLKAQSALQWPQILRQYGSILPEVRKTLQDLHERGARLGIVTGSRENSMQFLREQDLLKWFDVVITGSDVVRRKPDPEGLLKCAERVGVEPERSVYVGDTPLDIQAGRAAGMSSVAVLSGAGDSALLSAAGPDWIIGSLPQLLQVLRFDGHLP